MIEDDQSGPKLDQQGADVLAGRICAQAGIQAQATCCLLELIGEFDAGGGLGFMRGAKSVAHWVSYTCSLAPGTSREYVRVARALREMPTVAAAFRSGELSYSKVREATRVVGVVEEDRLCRLALAESASQFALTLQKFRAAAGTRMPQQDRRRLSLVHRDDNSVGMSARIPAEDAGVIAAALRKARGLNAEPPEKPTTDGPDHEAGRGTPEFGDADAMLAICNHYLATAEGRDDSGEDRHLVVVEVAAEQLAPESPTVVAEAADVPAGTPPVETVSGSGDIPAGRSEAGSTVGDVSVVAQDVPAGAQGAEATSEDAGWARRQACGVRGIGGIEPATAQRLACNATLLGAIVDAHGDVLALGRTRRLVSKAQRRALMVRDESCRFPGCTRRTHLEAHHRVSWSAGGSTDLENLVLLCWFHHLTVHEGGISIVRAGSGDWEFVMPDGQSIATKGWRVPTADRLTRELAEHHATVGVDHVDSYIHPDAIRIRPQQYGERFSLHDSVQAVFGMMIPQDQQAA